MSRGSFITGRLNMIRALLSSTALATALLAAPAFADDQKAPEADVAGATGAGGGDRALPTSPLRLDRGAAHPGGRVHPSDGPSLGQRSMTHAAPQLSVARILAVLIKEFIQLTRDRAR